MSARRSLERDAHELLEVLDHHELGGDLAAGRAAQWIRDHLLDAGNLAAWREAAQAIVAYLNHLELGTPPGELLAWITERAQRGAAWIEAQSSLPPATIVLDRKAAGKALGLYATLSRHEILDALEAATLDRARS